MLARGLRPGPVVVFLCDACVAGETAGSLLTLSVGAGALRLGLADGAVCEVVSFFSFVGGCGAVASLVFGGRPARLVGGCCGDAVVDDVVVGGDAGMAAIRRRSVFCKPFFVLVAGTGAGSGAAAAVVFARLDPRVNVKSPSRSSYTAAARYVVSISSQNIKHSTLLAYRQDVCCSGGWPGCSCSSPEAGAVSERESSWMASAARRNEVEGTGAVLSLMHALAPCQCIRRRRNRDGVMSSLGEGGFGIQRRVSNAPRDDWQVLGLVQLDNNIQRLVFYMRSSRAASQVSVRLSMSRRW